MKTATSTLAGVLLVLGAATIVTTATTHVSDADSSRTNMQPPSTTTMVETVASTAPGPTAMDDETVSDPAADKLTAYTLGAMNSWPHATIPTAPFDEVAKDIVEVALAEESAWDGDESRARTAILMAGLAYWEGARYAEYVWDGSCNAWMHQAWAAGWGGHPNLNVLGMEARQLLRYGTCDGGMAYGFGQIHATTWYDGQKYITLSPELLSDHMENFRAMLMIARRSLRATGTLNMYAGPGGEEKARVRLDFVEKYLREHPFTP